MRPKLSKYLLGLSLFSVAMGAVLLLFFGHQNQPKNLKSAHELLSEKLSQRQDFSGKLNLTSMSRYFKDPKLMDPRSRLPQSHLYDRSSLALLYRYAKDCRGGSQIKQLQVGQSLSKLRNFHMWKCGDLKSLPKRFIENSPYMHPAGVSYAFLLWNSKIHPPVGVEFLQNNFSFFHIDDLAKLDKLPDQLESPGLLRLIKLEQSVRSAILFGQTVAYSPKTKQLFYSKQSETPGSKTSVIFSKETFEEVADDIGVAIVRPGFSNECESSDDLLCIIKIDARSPLFKNFGFGLIVFGILILFLLGAWLSFYRLRQLKRDQELKKLIYRTFVHEFRTPITALKLDIENLRPSFDKFGESVQDSFLRICDGVGRLERLVAASVAYINDRTDKAYSESSFELGQLLGSPDYRSYLERDSESVAKNIELFGDPSIVHMLVGIIIDNAKQHGALPIKISLDISNDFIRINVQDGGKWIPSDAKRPPGSGMGIGLALVHNWVERMGGAVEYSKEPTTVSIRLRRSK